MLSLESPVKLIYGSVKCCTLVPRPQLPVVRLIFMCYCMVESVAYDRNRVVALKLGKATDLP